MRRLKIKIGLSLISLEIEALTNLPGNKSFGWFQAQENVTVFFKVKVKSNFGIEFKNSITHSALLRRLGTIFRKKLCMQSYCLHDLTIQKKTLLSAKNALEICCSINQLL